MCWFCWKKKKNAFKQKKRRQAASPSRTGPSPPNPDQRNPATQPAYSPRALLFFPFSLTAAPTPLVSPASEPFFCFFHLPVDPTSQAVIPLLQRRETPVFMALKAIAAVLIPALRAIIRRPEHPYKTPSSPPSISPTRHRPSRPQAAEITRRSPLLRRRRRPIPASPSNPEPSTLPYQLCHVLALLPEFFLGLFCYSRASPPPAPELRRHSTFSDEQLSTERVVRSHRNPVFSFASTLRTLRYTRHLPFPLFAQVPLLSYSFLSHC